MIVISLVGAGLLMALCIRFLPDPGMDRYASEEIMARQRLLRTAITLLHDERFQTPDTADSSVQDRELKHDVIDRLSQSYENRLSQIDESHTPH